ncbi:MAG TPA: permease [Oxalobacteraceae bacterium]|jgi:cell division transport system permease protein|nr:permease [Oxalobacteraceae bacterium]
MRIWLRQHASALTNALRHLFKPRSGFLLNVLVVAIALALPFAGLTLLENMLPVSGQIAVDPEISVFLKTDTPRAQALALAPQLERVLRESHNTAKVEFIPREKALNALKAQSGLADAVAALGVNPLPDGYVLKLAGFQDVADAARIDTIAAALQALPGVEYVQVDSAWVKRLAALLHVLQLVLLFLAATLGTVVIAVVFNTIRLQVMTQREEIEISRLFGATDTFIYRPFYYTGALLGLCAGVLALGVVALALQPLNDAIADFAHLYASTFRMAPLGPGISAILLALSATLGLAGSLFSVRRHLARSN